MSIFPDYNSPAALNAFLEARGMGMRKKFGQNFLVNGAAREKLVDALEMNRGDSVWEVGPGLGAMTRGVLDRGGNLTAFEVDKGFCIVLRELFADAPGFTLVEGDVLKTWRKNALAGRSAPIAAKTPDTAPRESAGVSEAGGGSTGIGAHPLFFGNLPYNIAATLIADFITGGFFFDRAVVTVQKEVAARMAAKPGSADYSSFSVLCGRFYDMRTVMDLAPGNFWPRPNVVSRAVRMRKKTRPFACSDDGAFFSIVRALFVSRRKTVKNNLSAWLAPRVNGGGDSCEIADFMLQYTGVPPYERAENLSPEVFCAFADAAVKAGVSVC